ncbi:chemotaxis protein CheB [Methylobacterium sp. J-026]|nr:chemotaxis protein CheB [Methylobacterium sp. J-026]
MLAALPLSIRAVILVVLHRSWDKPSNLKPVLERACTLPVVIAEEDDKFEQGTVYIGEPAQHLTLAARSLGEIIHDPDRVHGNRTVDLLFRSVARHGQGRMIGIVLSGSLDDGSRGLAAIHEAGGLTMVLTPDPEPYRGMPRNAINYDGPVDVIGSPRVIAAAIIKSVAKG